MSAAGVLALRRINRLKVFVALGCLILCAYAAIDLVNGGTEGEKTEVRWYKAGKTTASGDSFDFTGISCAVKDRKAMGRWFRFYCEGNVVYAYANDLIPKTSPGKYELSAGAFKRLAPLERGVIECRVKEAK